MGGPAARRTRIVGPATGAGRRATRRPTQAVPSGAPLRATPGPTAAHTAPAGKLTVGGAGAERDRTGDDELVGGVATFEADAEWGVGRWWRTVNGRDFDFVFCVTPAEESGEAARPAWTGEAFDAPGPARVTFATFRTILSD